MIMSIKMSDNSQFCEFEWFKWVMLQDKTGAYPNDHFRLGRYLGRSIDIGPALIAKIIKQNGQVLYRSMYRALTQDEWRKEECKNKCSSLMDSVHQALGPCTRLSNLVDLGVQETPQYVLYEDKLHNAETFPMLAEEPEITPEWRDQYVNAEKLLQGWDKMARDQVIHWKHNADGNPISRSNKNPILDRFQEEE